MSSLLDLIYVNFHIKYPNLNLKQGTSDQIEFDNQYFNVVILGFCLYLVDRELLFKTISEVDRTLKQGGYLVITDFETPFPSKIGVFCETQNTDVSVLADTLSV